MDLENLKVSELKNKCKSFNLPIYGTKKILVQRIRQHLRDHQQAEDLNEEDDVELNLQIEESSEEIQLEDVPINEPANDDENDDAEDDDLEEYSSEPNRNKKRKRFTFFYSNDFDSLEEAKIEVEEKMVSVDACWSFDRCRKTKDGLKYFYYCRVSSGCCKKLFIIEHAEDD